MYIAVVHRRRRTRGKEGEMREKEGEGERRREKEGEGGVVTWEEESGRRFIASFILIHL